MELHDILALVGEVITLIGVLLSVCLSIGQVMRGQRCLLRSEMLRIYYHNQDNQQIRQYEYENFVMLYEAYKRLKGNSFIDKIYTEIQKWTVTT